MLACFEMWTSMWDVLFFKDKIRAPYFSRGGLVRFRASHQNIDYGKGEYV